MLLPRVQGHHLFPVAGHILKAVITAQVNQIEDVLLEATAAKSRAGLEKLGADAAVSADRIGHLAHVGTGGLTEGGDAVDRADPLRQKSIRSELAELAAPKIGAQNFLRSHPVAVDPRQRLNRFLGFPTD